VGLITFRDITKHRAKPNANKDEFGRLRVAAAVGVTADLLERTSALVTSNVDAVVIDTAHGHTKGVAAALKNVKEAYPDLDVVVGNIATASAAKYIADLGADAVKVGIGPGSICTTRVIAGVGYPQLSAITEVYKTLGGSDIPIIADGGIRYTGTSPRPSLQEQMLSCWGLCWLEPKNLPEKPSFLKEESLKPIAEWVL
jgi:IMP dehydrogenase